MKHKSENYNLLVEDWIPVLRTDGRFERVGIRIALTEASSIRQIAASNPMDRLAILRLLLALVYWCKGNPPEEVSANSDYSFPAHWFSKLEENQDCFNLLGKRKRFYQCAPSGSGRPPEQLTANYLIHEIPTGTNKWHFRHSTDGVHGLCPACSAMGLLRLPLFATSGGRGKPPGINAKPPVYVISTAASLAGTLRLLWRQASELGTPAWVEPDLKLPVGGEVPLLVGLTWLPRRVWLGDALGPETKCMSCGRRERLIRRCVFAGIGSTKIPAGGPGRTWRDPHVVYGVTSRGDLTSLHANNALDATDAAAGQWSRILAGILTQQRALDNQGNAWAVGFATVRNDKYLEAMEYTIRFPCEPHRIEDCIEKIERWQKEGASLVRKLSPRNKKASSRKHIEIPPMVAAIRPHVEEKVSAKSGELLVGEDDLWEQAAGEYRPLMCAIAESLSPGFTTAAVQRRRHIASVTLDMRPRIEADKKATKKKGGDK